MQLRDPDDGARSRVGTGLAAAAMVGLLAIAAAATHAHGTGASAPPGSRAAAVVGHHLTLVGMLVLAPIMAITGCALLLYAQVQRRRELDPVARRRLAVARLRSAFVLMTCLALLVYYVRTRRNPFAFLHLRNPLGEHGASAHAAAAGHASRAPNGTLSTADWAAAVLAWAALLAVAILLLVRRRRRLQAAAAARVAEAAIAEPDELDVDAVRRELDPRRAVIAAYAFMERLLARDGLPRGLHEAPMEYLGRVTRNGHARVAQVHRLTALFQRARFSDRPVDESMRRRALRATEELAAETEGDPA